MNDVREKISEVVAKRNLVSHMNNSRWSDLLPILNSLASRIMVKPLLWEDEETWTDQFLIPFDGYFEPLPMGPIKYSEIEWLLIDPINVEICKNRLKEFKVAFTEENNLYKIWGYTDSGRNFI